MMNYRSTITLLFAVATMLLAVSPATAEEMSPPDEEDDGFELSLQADLGFVTPLYHRIQYSEDTTYFDYVADGGQDVLFPFSRLSAETTLGDRHHITFLWQPLRLETEVRLNQDVAVDDVVFEEGQPMELLYNFPYYRTTYLYDLIESDDTEFSVGGGLQIRNATISFQTADGELRRDRRDLGFVPLLKLRGHHNFDNHWFIGGEAAGFYAPVRYLNLRDVDVIGAILDADLRAGRHIDDHVSAYLSARYIGGGSEGTADRPEDEPGDGFTRNWINAVALTLGFEYTF